MTREEEIEKAWVSKCVQSNHCYDEKSFKEGVEWADRNPKNGLVNIDEVCKYLDDVLYEVVSGISGLHDVMSIENTTMEDFIKNFRKAMEE